MTDALKCFIPQFMHACFALIVLSGGISLGVNAADMITNGDFEAGNSGFQSDYISWPGLPTVFGEGYYTVVDNPNTLYPAFQNIGDHTSGSGLMLTANGAPSSDSVWRQTAAVVPGTTYLFSAYASSLFNGDPSPANLLIQADVTADCATAGSFQNIGIINAAADPSWIASYAALVIPVNGVTSICLRILNDNTALTGNDFALDDIALVDDDTRFPITANDTASTLPSASVLIEVLDNDTVRSDGIDPTTIDLDAGTTGIQTSYSVVGAGVFTVESGQVRFTPESGFIGSAIASYRVSSENGIPSNVSTITVSVSASSAQAVPTMSTWGLMMLAGALGWLAATIGRHQRRC